MKYVMAMALLSLMFLPGMSQAQGACMVSGLEGQATLFHGNEQAQTVTRFKKLWPGDRVELLNGATLQLNYLAIGRLEDWKGPASITITEKSGQGQNDRQQPTVANIANLDANLKTSAILNQQNVSGQISVRGMHASRIVNAPLESQGQQELERVKVTYENLLKKGGRGDVTADMYYLASLEQLGQKELMARHIHKLLSMYGSNPELEEMLDSL